MSAIKDIRKRLELGLRLYYRSPWVRAPYTSAEAPIIVGGCDRSGTTLLRATLDSHPDIAAGPESWVFVYKIKPDWLASEFGFEPSFVRSLMKESGSLAEFIDRFMDAYRKRENRPVWCEKSPRNILRLDWIWERFPKARVIHIVRDGRDVSCSLRNHPKRKRVGDAYVPTNINRPISRCIDHWIRYVSAGIQHRGDERYMEVRYEDLIADYEATTKRICAHCNVEWSPAILDRESRQQQRTDVEIVNPEVRQPLYQSAVSRWKRDLSADEQALCLRKAGHLLEAFGYLNDQADEPEAPPRRVPEAVSS